MQFNKEESLLLAKAYSRHGKENKTLWWHYDYISGKSWHKIEDTLYHISIDWLITVATKLKLDIEVDFIYEEYSTTVKEWNVRIRGCQIDDKDFHSALYKCLIEYLKTLNT